MTKYELINELLHDPLNFEEKMMMDDLIGKEGDPPEKRLNFVDIRDCIRRIYDLSESQLREASNANEGIMGKLNKKSTARRIWKFNRRIRKLKKDKGHKIIYAEGDSWFQFPIFIRDIIDWLNRNKNYIIYSDAYGGDWITNIIYESQYVSALSVLRPDVFLISGGGNDLVSNNRLAIMVKKYSEPQVYRPKYTSQKPINNTTLTREQRDMIMKAQEHITREFYAFLLVIKAQYLLLFNSLYFGINNDDSKFKDMISITQGYDYAIPGLKPKWKMLHLFQVCVNAFAGNGDWLKRPLLIRGFFDEYLQRALVLTFIYEFNQIFISLANNPRFPNLYHIDCRGLADSPKRWIDELHYKSKTFRRVADAYKSIIDRTIDPHIKVIKP